MGLIVSHEQEKKQIPNCAKIKAWCSRFSTKKKGLKNTWENSARVKAFENFVDDKYVIHKNSNEIPKWTGKYQK